MIIYVDIDETICETPPDRNYKLSNPIKENIKKIEEIASEINFHNNLYYNKDKPSISDAEYDKLVRELKELIKKNPDIDLKNNPIYKIGGTA